MKLAVGMRVIDTRSHAQLTRYQVVAFSKESVHVRRVVLRHSGGLLDWFPPEDEINKVADGWLRRDFEACFRPDPDDPRART